MIYQMYILYIETENGGISYTHFVLSRIVSSSIIQSNLSQKTAQGTKTCSLKTRDLLTQMNYSEKKVLLTVSKGSLLTLVVLRMCST